jgi:processive 1,2-diacylglycerol beta-glucosyltransferase
VKYRILSIVYPKIGGCQYYRQVHPQEQLPKFEDFEIVYKPDITFVPDNELWDFQLVQFHKNHVTPEGLIRLTALGIPTIVDFDDYWHLPHNHLSYERYRNENLPARFIEIIRLADYVSVTTQVLADEVKRHNSNVFVFPNVLNPDCQQVYPIEIKSDCLRFGYLAGSHHLPDVELLRGLNNRLENSGLKYSLALFGYKHDGAYFDYAGLLTNNANYTDNLVLYPSLPVPDYLMYYNLLDVVLVPLVANKFNSLKSELKLIEAGTFAKAMIISDVMPYKPFLKDKINCLAVKNKKDWFRKIKYLANNPNAATDIGNQLHHDIQEHFNYEKITKYRAGIYKEIIQKG